MPFLLGPFGDLERTGEYDVLPHPVGALVGGDLTGHYRHTLTEVGDAREHRAYRERVQVHPDFVLAEEFELSE
ncbi:MAG: hypothetical protein F4Y49_10640 [Dehalococcoidia bacterium]|nr:hypothetical protein [Dehalococcoidia bacterium]